MALMQRYIVINKQKNIINGEKREMVLLRGKPCSYGKCAFCDYHLDNVGHTLEEIILFNRDVLSHVTGEFGVLEVINSGSIFEIPEESLNEIFEICKKKKIHKIYFEAFITYKEQLEKIKEKFSEISTKVKFRLGVESFSENFRINVLRKGILNTDILAYASQYESACLLVGVEGQTREMVISDIEEAKKHFNKITLNVFSANTTEIKENRALKEWFYAYSKELRGEKQIEVFLDNDIF
ncbi:MAG: radical SAM protein [Fusobacteria bacterium]|nr:radical SAM protein [Fusobacteriota bacterium]